MAVWLGCAGRRRARRPGAGPALKRRVGRTGTCVAEVRGLPPSGLGSTETRSSTFADWTRDVPMGYTGIYTPKGIYAPKRDIFLTDITGYDRLQLYVKI